MEKQVLLNQFNKATERFRAYIKKHNGSLDPKDWKIRSAVVGTNNVVSFTTHNVPASVLSGEGNQSFYLLSGKNCEAELSVFPETMNGATLNYRIACSNLFSDVVSGTRDALQQVAEIAFTRKITTSDIDRVLDRSHVKVIPHFDELLKAVKSWTYDVTFETSILLGQRLYKATEHFPQFRQSPSNTLYRCIIVAKTLVEKAQHGKTIILKKRTYSSWTYDPKAAKWFARTKINEVGPEHMFVIFKKQFTDANVVCNIEAVSAYLKKYSEFRQEFAKREKEIVVRNPQNNFVFRAKDIYLYGIVDDKHIRWKSKI